MKFIPEVSFVLFTRVSHSQSMCLVVSFSNHQNLQFELLALPLSYLWLSALACPVFRPTDISTSWVTAVFQPTHLKDSSSLDIGLSPVFCLYLPSLLFSLSKVESIPWSVRRIFPLLVQIPLPTLLNRYYLISLNPTAWRNSTILSPVKPFCREAFPSSFNFAVVVFRAIRADLPSVYICTLLRLSSCIVSWSSANMPVISACVIVYLPWRIRML